MSCEGMIRVKHVRNQHRLAELPTDPVDSAPGWGVRKASSLAVIFAVSQLSDEIPRPPAAESEHLEN